MSSREKNDRMIFLFKSLLATLYMVMGVVIFFIKDRPVFDSYPQYVKIGFSVLCIAYGAFRLYRALQKEE
jgi:hypothetical protein